MNKPQIYKYFNTQSTVNIPGRGSGASMFMCIDVYVSHWCPATITGHGDQYCPTVFLIPAICL